MNNPLSSYQKLIKAIQENALADTRLLWIADENMPYHCCRELAAFSHLTFVTNRFDLHQAALQTLTKADHIVLFNDFDLQSFEDGSFETVAYRVSKERPVCHWVLSQTARVLNHQGTLLLVGQKDEGIKGYADKCIEQLGFAGKPVKSGNDYLARLALHKATKEQLDHKNYPDLRTIAQAFHLNIHSKPGLYGWQKIDEGSVLLVEEFIKLASTRTYQSALDLGCGYGYLSMAMANYGISRIVATDNNAAAIMACRDNIQTFKVDTQVIAGDCADSVNESVDLVLCNPPFHQGFSVDSQLTEKFVAATANHLRKGGDALFVVNTFIAIEKVAQRYFKQITLMANNRKFKVLKLRHRE